MRPELVDIGRHAAILEEQLQARWSIVEASFDAGIGRNLITAGVTVSADGQHLFAPARRVAVTGSRSALAGFQHGRCFYSSISVEYLMTVHGDHVYPFALMKTGSWIGPNLNGVWNLVVACRACNLHKSDRLPTTAEVLRLVGRNEAISSSPHPLRRTLELAMRPPGAASATTRLARVGFLRDVDRLVLDRGLS